jgi:voltage-gated potassium channel
MAKEELSPQRHGNSYNIFILVLTVLSLLIMVALLLPLSTETIKLLTFYDNLVCFIFLIDFFFNLKNSPTKSDYFIKQRGWLDLLGSIPSLGLLFNVGKFAGLLRLARLSRLARIMHLLRGENKKALVNEISSPIAASMPHF